MNRYGDLWVFGYGSLMWRPGFPFIERRHAQLNGYHRSLCVLSHVHRGTPRSPGSCSGSIGAGAVTGWRFGSRPRGGATVHYLREREQVTAVYLERRLPVRLADGRSVDALAYIADRRHRAICGTSCPNSTEVLRIVRRGRGVRRRIPDYVRSTYDHLVGMGVVDPLLRRIVEAMAGS